MSGHNKWSSIKHKKAKVDAQRGRIFTRLIKEITVAARMGGGDEESNPRLRAAVAAAKAANMPSAKIERAIKRGTGELPGVTYEEATYEGYGPGGAALLIETLTDNKNRTVADLRHILSKYNGNLGESGSVAWIFEKKGVIVIQGEGLSEDDVMMAVLDAGAEDIKSDGTNFEVLTAPEDFEAVKKAVGHDFPVEMAPRRAGDPATVVAGAKRIRKELGWSPEYANLDTIVEHAYKWEKHLQDIGHKG